MEQNTNVTAPEEQNVQVEEKKSPKPKKEKKGNTATKVARKKKLRYGSVATVITCVVVAIVVVINILVNILVETYPLKLDLTSSGLFEISEETIEYLAELDQDVEFVMLADESAFQSSSTYMLMVAEMLERYPQYTSHITLSYVNPTTNPDVVNTYQNYYSGTLAEGDLIVANASDFSKLRVVNIDDMFTYDSEKFYYYYYYGYYSLDECITAFSGEQDLTSALLYVTDADPVNVAMITTASGEYIYNYNYYYNTVVAYADMLESNGYNVVEVDIYSDSLDTDSYDMIVLPAPTNDLTEDGIDKIAAFLYNSGSYGKYMVYFADIYQSSTPNIDELLASWGIEVSNYVIMESDSNAALQYGSTAYPAATLVSEDYTVTTTTLPTIAPLCRAINVLWESQSGGITDVVLQTSDTSYLYNLDAESDDDQYTYDCGAQCIAVTSTRKTDDASSTILVYGALTLVDSTIMSSTAYNNQELVATISNTLTGKGDSIVIAEKDLSVSYLTMTESQLSVTQIVVYAIPFIVILIGVVIFVRRRNR